MQRFFYEAPERKNDLKKTDTNSYILGTFGVDINYSVVN